MKKSPTLVLIKIFLLEILRERWFLGVLFFALLLLGLGRVLGTLGLNEQQRILFHLSFSAIHLIGFALALVLGSTTLLREVERQTCLLILARPLTRTQFLISKAAAIAIFLAIFDYILVLVIAAQLGDLSFFWGSLLGIVTATWMEHLLVLALAIFSSLLMSTAVAGLFTSGYFIIGQWLPDLEFFAKKSDNEAFQFLSALSQWIFPHFYDMNLRSIYFLKEGFDLAVLGRISFHFLTWFAVLSYISLIIWRRRDLV